MRKFALSFFFALLLAFLMIGCQDNQVIDNKVEMRVYEGFLQWKTGDRDWNNLITIEELEGSDGIGIESITINASNQLVIKYTNGEEKNLGSVVGQDGVSITNLSINDRGELIITLSDNQTINAGRVMGSDGREIELRNLDGNIEWRYVGEEEWQNLISLSELKGADGIGIDSVTINENNELIIRYSDDSEVNLGNIKGMDGLNGISIVNVHINDTGHLIITLSNDEVIDAGLVIPEAGEDGLSAYEIYLQYHPLYSGTEEMWLDDLVNGRLGSWEKLEVTFNTNSGNLPEEFSSSVLVDKWHTVLLPVPTREGYHFLGWFTGNEIYDAQFVSAIPVVEDITLYARWKQINVEDFMLDIEYLEISQDETINLEYTIYPANALNKKIVPFENEFISINEFGAVTGLSMGTTTVTIYTEDGSYSDSLTVTVIDTTNPEMISVTPEQGVVVLESPFRFSVTAYDKHLYELEIDHSVETLPEFSVYANSLNPYGSEEARVEFENRGVFVTYDELTQTWTIDFGSDCSYLLLMEKEVTFYLVLHDESGNKWGSMYDVTLDNTFIYTFYSLEGYILELIKNSDTYEEMNTNLSTYGDVIGIDFSIFDSFPTDGNSQQAIINAMIYTRNSFNTLYDIGTFFAFLANKEFMKTDFTNSVNNAINSEEMKNTLYLYVPSLFNQRHYLISIGFTDLSETNYTTAMYELYLAISTTDQLTINYVAETLFRLKSENQFTDSYSITDAIRAALDSDYIAPVLVEVNPSSGTIVIDGQFTWIIRCFDENLYALEIDHTISGLPEFSIYASEENPYGSDEARLQFEEYGVIVTYDSLMQAWTINFGNDITNMFVTEREVTFYLVVHDEAGNKWGSMYDVTRDNTFNYSFITLEEYVFSLIMSSDSYTDMLNHLVNQYNVIGISEEAITYINNLPDDSEVLQVIINGMLASKSRFTNLQSIADTFVFFINKEILKEEFINAVDDSATILEMKEALRNYVPYLNDLRQYLISEGFTDLVGTNYTTSLFDLDGFILEENEFVLDYVSMYLIETRLNTYLGRFQDIFRITDAIRTALDSDYTPPTLVSVFPECGFVPGNIPFQMIITANDANLYKLEIDHSITVLPEFSVYANPMNPYGSEEARLQFESFGVTVSYDEYSKSWTIDFGADLTALFLSERNVTFYLVIHDESGNTWGSMYEVRDENTFLYTFVTMEEYVLEEIKNSDTYEEMKTNIFAFVEIIGIDHESIDVFNSLPLDQGRQQAIINGMIYMREYYQYLSDIKMAFEFLVFKEYTKYEFINAVDNAYDVNEMKDALYNYVPLLNDIRQFLIGAGFSELEGTNYTTSLYELTDFIYENNEFVIEYVAETLLRLREETPDNKFYGIVPITDAIRFALDSDYIAPILYTPEPNPGITVVNERFTLNISAYDENLYQLVIYHSIIYYPEFIFYADSTNPYGSEEARFQYEQLGITVNYDDYYQMWSIYFNEEFSDLLISQRNVIFDIDIFDESGNGDLYNVFEYTFLTYEDYVLYEIVNSATNELMLSNLVLYQNSLGITEELNMFNNLSLDKQAIIINGMVVSRELFTSLAKVKTFFNFYVNNA